MASGGVGGGLMEAEKQRLNLTVPGTKDDGGMEEAAAWRNLGHVPASAGPFVNLNPLQLRSHSNTSTPGDGPGSPSPGARASEDKQHH